MEQLRSKGNVLTDGVGRIGNRAPFHDALKAASAKPSAFGRMIAYGTLRRTLDEVRQGELDAETSALKVLHRRAFGDWLALTLAEQRDDILIYLDGLPVRSGIVADLMEFGAAGLPTEIADLETQLFISDLSVVRSSLMWDSRSLG